MPRLSPARAWAARARPGRWGLTGRVAVLVVLACVVTAGVGLAISLSLVVPTNDRAARASLGRLADLTASRTLDGEGVQGRRALAALKVGATTVSTTGELHGGGPDVRAAATPSVVASLLAGNPVSTTATVHGHNVLVEGRPLRGGGGIVLVERHADAVAVGTADARRTGWALAIAVALTVVVGVLLTRRLVRPLRMTAAAAHALAAGRRDVFVAPEGPTEIVEVATALNGLSHALAVSEGRQRDFLLSVSHDLRTPLTAIVGYAESLRTGVVTGDEAREFVVGIEGEAYRLERMVGDLLGLARLGAEDFALEPTEVDLTEVTAAAARAWAVRCSAAGVRFVSRTPPFPVPIVIDAGRLRQMIDALVDNALRVTPAGEVVVLDLDVGPGRQTVIEVRDSGPGLTDQDVAVAFERGALFERYRGVRQVGTGLGLAIVARLAARMGVEVQAGHAAEGGARFTLALPHGYPLP